MLPTFIVIGAGKAGTTSLWGYLRDHPQVFMSEPKELNFFTVEHNWSKGVDWYEAHFAGAGDAVARGEASGSYTNWPNFAGVPERMASVVPDARLVYVIRHPVERIVSAYKYRRVRETEHLPIEEAIWSEPMYLDVSRYAQQIEQFLLHYPRERLHVVVSEAMRSDRVRTMQEVFEFVGVDPERLPDSLGHEFNRTDRKLRQPRRLVRAAQHLPGYRQLADRAPSSLRTAIQRVGTRAIVRDEESQLDDATREAIVDALRDDTRKLRGYLGDDFDCWGLA
jgi:hypothetical protein